MLESVKAASSVHIPVNVVGGSCRTTMEDDAIAAKSDEVSICLPFKGLPKPQNL